MWRFAFGLVGLDGRCGLLFAQVYVLVWGDCNFWLG